jgi:hypothetical protein
MEIGKEQKQSNPLKESGSSPPPQSSPAHPNDCKLLGKSLLTVSEAASLLNVFECWVRRHIHELPVVRLGGAVRLDSALLLRQTQGKLPAGNRLKTGEKMGLQLRRYQRGYVYKTAKKVKVWYGMWREDVSDPNGKTGRRQRNIG